jgi:hypothetical protein
MGKLQSGAERLDFPELPLVTGNRDVIVSRARLTPACPFFRLCIYYEGVAA